MKVSLWESAGVIPEFINKGLFSQDTCLSPQYSLASGIR